MLIEKWAGLSDRFLFFTGKTVFYVAGSGKSHHYVYNKKSPAGYSPAGLFCYRGNEFLRY
jgi:hypothetical protein